MACNNILKNVVFLGILLSTSSANADFITLLSETHRIEGGFWFLEGSCAPTTDTIPLGCEVFGIDTTGEFGGTGGFAASAAGNFKVFAEILASGGGKAYAQSTYTFTSDESKLQLNYYGFAETSNNYESATTFISLTNLTTGPSLLFANSYSALCDCPIFGSKSFNETILLDLHSGDHRYELTIIAEAYIRESGGHGSEMTVRFTPVSVPEPTSFLLFGTGFLGLAAWCRHRQRKISAHCR